MEHETPDMQRDIAWFNSERKMQELYKKGIGKMLEQENAETLFEDGESCLCCIDEGTDSGLFRAAGSGILLSDEERATLVDRLQAMGVKGVKSHEGCGAADKYCKDNNITDKTVEEVAKEKAQQIAKELGVPYLGHIEKLSRPAEFHYARTVYYDGTGQFNQAAVGEKLPPGFVISRRYLDDKSSIDNLQLAIQIALGHHGFGKKITKDKPLMLVALGDPHDSMFDAAAMQKEMDDFLKQLAEKDPQTASRVRLDVANAPISHETRN
jgi:hypothetical protein